MGFLDRLARRLECEDTLAPADAILILDGGEIGERFVTGLDLLRRGYAPRLLLSHATNGGLACQDAQALAGEDWKKIYWMASEAASTRKESIAARHALKRFGCSSGPAHVSPIYVMRHQAAEGFSGVDCPDG